MLGYAEKILVLHGGKLLRFDTPKSLYNNPRHALIASFFEEFTVLQRCHLYEISDKNGVIVYAHELKPTKDSKFKVKVIKNYYKGNFYLIEGEFNGKAVFFTSKKKLTPSTIVNLKVTLGPIKRRSDFMG